MSVRIRKADAADAEDVQAIYAPFVSGSPTSFETVVPDVVDIRQRIEDQATRYPWLVLEADGRVLGYAYASAHRARQAYQWSVDVSVYVHAAFHRRGIGRALYVSLFDFLRRQHFVNAYAGITLPNASSIGLHQSLGFQMIGTYRSVGFKFDRWHDVTWLHLPLQSQMAQPRELLPTHALWTDAGMIEVFRCHAGDVSLG